MKVTETNLKNVCETSGKRCLKCKKARSPSRITGLASNWVKVGRNLAMRVHHAQKKILRDKTKPTPAAPTQPENHRPQNSDPPFFPGVQPTTTQRTQLGIIAYVGTVAYTALARLPIHPRTSDSETITGWSERVDLDLRLELPKRKNSCPALFLIWRVLTS